MHGLGVDRLGTGSNWTMWIARHRQHLDHVDRLDTGSTWTMSRVAASVEILD